MQLILEIHHKTITSEHRGHLCNSSWDYRIDYTIKTFEPSDDIAYPELKLDLDTMDDYQRQLQKPYIIDMSAVEIVNSALEHKEKTTI